jgi:hypothetical protein
MRLVDKPRKTPRPIARLLSRRCHRTWAGLVARCRKAARLPARLSGEQRRREPRSPLRRLNEADATTGRYPGSSEVPCANR